MSISKYTPGPWTSAPCSDGRIKIKAGELCSIAIVFKQPSDFVANVWLIAAAPELLETLELVLNDNRLMNAMSKTQARAILDAITKATGGAK